REVVAGKIEPASGTTVIDARGKHVYPGLIAPYTHLGLNEIGSVRPSRDIDETGGVTPEVRASVAVNPDSWLLPVTRANGVLLAGVFPTGDTIPGRAGVIRLDGWTSEEMAASTDAGLVVEWPLMRVVRAPWMDRPEEEQLKDIRAGLERVRETFKTAAAYCAQPKPATPDVRWEAMRAVFADAAAADGQRPQKPVFVLANDYDQIVAAVELKRRHGLKMVVVGGLEAPRCAKLLKDEDVPVIVTNVMTTPRHDDSAYDENYGLPARLHKAGVRFAIATGDETPHERNLPYAAAMAAAHGLDPDQALRAVTLSAAEILGVADRYGSIDQGKSATLLVTDGNPLEVGTVIEKAYIDERLIDLSTKQTALAAKYRERYRQMKEAEKKSGGPEGRAAK
ncbi:MAG: amidohydrolase family protein, partial [Phycisphaerales bacterium]|nr:amidohydrolase family protein [Phycisphaerales bacterium]